MTLRHHISTLLLLWLTVYSASAQGIAFFRSYGNDGVDKGRSVAECLDSGYIVTGLSSSFSSDADAFLLRVDQNGNMLWSRSYGQLGSEEGVKVLCLPDSGYIVCGRTNSFVGKGFDFYAFRTDKDGNKLWQKNYGSADWEHCHAARLVGDTAVVMTGMLENTVDYSKDIYTVMIDTAGDTLWTQVYSTPMDEWANDVVVNDTMLVMIGGYTPDSITRPFMLTYDLQGNQTSVRTPMDTTGLELVSGEWSMDRLVMGGIAQDTLASQPDFWVGDYDLGQDLLQADFVSGSYGGRDRITDICVGQIRPFVYYTGTSTSFSVGSTTGVNDMYLGKLQRAGLWWQWYVETIGEPGVEELYEVIETKDGGTISVGWGERFSSGGGNVYLLKVDSLGYYPSYPTQDIITTSVDENEFVDYRSWPNPVSKEGTLYIETAMEARYHIALHDLSGRLQLEMDSKGTFHQVELSGLNPGLKILRLQCEKCPADHQLILVE